MLGFVLLAATLSTAILACRNIFDDEIFSLPFVTGSVGDIVEVAREGDVHPPGMYLLAHMAWRVLPSYRWLNLLPEAALFAGLAVFLVWFMPALRDRRAAVCVLLFGALHPQLLMWSNTLRWYCPWTGLALMASVVFLQPRRTVWRMGWRRGCAGVGLLAAMFYLSYMTLLFAVALAAALWVRLRGSAVRREWRGLLACVVAFAVLIAPQLRTMLTVHLPNSAAQRGTIVVSALRLGQALAGSEAYLPWNGLALLASVVTVSLVASGVWRVLRGVRGTDTADAHCRSRSVQPSLVVFGLVFLGLVIASGLGEKPRNAVLLLPVFAPAVGAGVERLGRWAQWAAVGVLAVWSGWGAAHLVGRFGLAKSNMNNRPEEVVRLIARGEARGDACRLPVTYDGGVAFELAQAHLPQMMILSPFRGRMFAGTLEDMPPVCERVRLYLVQSYASGEPDRDWKYTQELEAAKGFIEGTAVVNELSRDPDATMKRRLSRAVGLAEGANLPDYRFVVFSGEMDRARLPELRRTLHYFVSGEEVVPDWPGDDQPGM